MMILSGLSSVSTVSCHAWDGTMKIVMLVCLSFLSGITFALVMYVNGFQKQNASTIFGNSCHVGGDFNKDSSCLSGNKGATEMLVNGDGTLTPPTLWHRPIGSGQFA
ncbi:hypothetical protein ACOSP7_018447 [Xanthoceras sorbifolium]